MASFCYILLFGCSGLVGFLILGIIVVALYGGGVGHFVGIGEGFWDPAGHKDFYNAWNLMLLLNLLRY